MTATKTRRTKIDDLYPPSDIRDNTKARRQWLADQVAATPAGFEAKIVGKGSYQSVSVYRVEQVEGRAQLRGHCQFCGNDQAVDADGLVVLHGYQRPGHGWIYGRCPGMAKLPLQRAQDFTEALAQDAVRRADDAAARLVAAKAEERAAIDALYPTTDSNVEPEAYTVKPHAPSSKATDEAKAAYRTARAQWEARFPIHARYARSQEELSDATTAAWQTRQQRDHFAGLLARRLLGTELITVVIP